MAAGIVVGVTFSMVGAPLQPVNDVLVDGLLDAIGRIFVALLQMMVVPLVLVSIVCGVASLGDLRALGRVGVKTLGLYLLTTAIALVLALTLARVVSPGQGFDLAGEVAYQSQPPPPLTEVFVNMFPANPVRALAEGQMLQIIFFALLLGFAITRAGEAGRRIGAIFSDLNAVIMKMVSLVIRTAPLGVFALITTTFAAQGLELFRPLAGYAIVVAVSLLLHVCLTYTAVLRLARLSPIAFLTKMRAVMTFAFSTASSSATIPLTLGTVKKRLGVGNSVASFTVPLGATINMDGTAIMQGVATVFIANVYGVDLVLADYLTVVLIATLASIGTAAVPSAGLIMLAMVLGQVDLPVEGIALIIGIDRLLDMMRTAVNVCGDGAVTCLVARTERALDLATFNDPDAVMDGMVRPAAASSAQ
ncbi:dicarboxylate/amino acid:cation symporter [Candidatus Rariloculus sp.]|uniref:dicarboxylate/amino acid:cation symporter n=1 Tax=Candidatus Rariloculus sp. TaxID=3101265 RepID=UPI003D12FB4F